MARGTRLAAFHPLLLSIPSIIGMIGCIMVDKNKSFLKHSLWGMFVGSEGLMMASLISFFEMPIIFNALAATAIMVGGLSLYAYMTPTQDFLSMQTPLMIGLVSLLGVSVVNMFWPSSLLYNLSMYGGLLLFGGFVLYDTHLIMKKAET